MSTKQELVTLSHELTRAVYSLSLNEKRVLIKAVALLDTYGGTDQMIEINAGECARFYGMNEKSAYRTLSVAVESLWNRTLVLKDGTKMRWVISCKYESGKISVKFHPDLNPHLLDLQSHFTRYLLSRAANFKLMYTWRLFELLIQFKRTGYMKIDLAEFKKILEIPEYYAEDFSRIRVKTIEPAIKEIREKDGMKVTWKPIKTGRKVTALEFKFPIEHQKALPLDNSYIEEHARPGESYAEARERLTRQRDFE